MIYMFKCVNLDAFDLHAEWPNEVYMNSNVKL